MSLAPPHHEARALVREYLRTEGMGKTLAAFTEESKAQLVPQPSTVSDNLEGSFPRSVYREAEHGWGCPRTNACATFSLKGAVAASCRG